ncbi:MAG: M13 family metallopeptidase [Gammaproteobacteria bacterium]|nr:M13 family metallopeptidase [Gammaproteobacteria bacterium]MBT7371439.1 M13 family metallopeptidase [Gammaproteobacteria bacterium]
MNTEVRPQDDFYEYANGDWLKSTEIPAEEVGWGSYMTLRKESLEQSKAIVLELAEAGELDVEMQKIADYYNAWMDETGIEEKAISPLSSDLEEIAALESHDQVAAYLGKANPMGIDGPFNFYVSQDDKDSTQYVVFFLQTGLGLPDRDYYFDESERGRQILVEYTGYITQILSLAGYEDPGGAAKRVIALETRLAEHQWDKVDNRDADKVYNPYSGEEFEALLSNLNLDDYMQGIGVSSQPMLVVMQPSYFEAVNEMFREIEVDTWKDYLRLRLVSSFANFLSDDFVRARFDFYSKTLYGREEQTPRWRRAVSSINGSLGELLGKVYVERHFAADSKARLQKMVHYLNLAYADSIRNLEWMSDETKEKALEKLAKFTPKIGYPDEWRDYSALMIAADDLVGNIKRSRTFSHNRNVDKLGKPIDRNEWFMAPQEVNAYYNPGLNEIVFPAAYLQSPNFISEADDAYNYGTVGTTIGHEIGHGFDDQGSKYDGDGNLKSWWTDDDRQRFETRTKGLVEQFNRFEPLPGLFVNGELTLGENIGDLGGTAIALKAYHMSREGAGAPVIDGFSAEERFFIGNAQSSRIKWREQFMEALVKNDPHSPDKYRVNGVYRNMEDFYRAFDVREGDGLYLAPEQRVTIWQ